MKVEENGSGKRRRRRRRRRSKSEETTKTKNLGPTDSLLDLARLVLVLEAKGLVLDDLFGGVCAGKSEETRGEFFFLPSPLSSSMLSLDRWRRRLSLSSNTSSSADNQTLTLALAFCLAAS